MLLVYIWADETRGSRVSTAGIERYIVAPSGLGNHNRCRGHHVPISGGAVRARDSARADFQNRPSRWSFFFFRETRLRRWTMRYFGADRSFLRRNRPAPARTMTITRTGTAVFKYRTAARSTFPKYPSTWLYAEKQWNSWLSVNWWLENQCKFTVPMLYDIVVYKRIFVPDIRLSFNILNRTRNAAKRQIIVVNYFVFIWWNLHSTDGAPVFNL